MAWFHVWLGLMKSSNHYWPWLALKCFFFPIKTNLYCHTSSLSIKHVNVLESRNVWVSIITSLLHLIMIGTKKHGARLENMLGPFSLHDASKSNLVILTKTRRAYFSTPLVMSWWQRWCVLHVVHIFLDIHE